MPVRKATPEETRAIFGGGRIIFLSGLRPPPGWKRPQATEAKPPEQVKAPDDHVETKSEE